MADQQPTSSFDASDLPPLGGEPDHGSFHLTHGRAAKLTKDCIERATKAGRFAAIQARCNESGTGSYMGRIIVRCDLVLGLLEVRELDAEDVEIGLRTQDLFWGYE